MLRRAWVWIVGGLGSVPLVVYVLDALASGLIGDAGGASIAYLRERFFPSADVLVLDFNATRGCSQGKLADIRKSFEDRAIRLENGAEILVICDTQSMHTSKATAPRDISVRFPGCVVSRGESLVMIRTDGAVCALPDERGFVCDGAKGRKPAIGVTGEPTDPVAPCSIDTLRRFGFS